MCDLEADDLTTWFGLGLPAVVAELIFGGACCGLLSILLFINSRVQRK